MAAVVRQESVAPPRGEEDAGFNVKGSAHTRQYAQMYYARLARVRERMRRAWPSDAARFCSLLRAGSPGDDAAALPIVVGTIYKEQALKPNVMDRYTKGQLLSAGHATGTVGSKSWEKLIDAEKDVVIIEDESARMRLILDSSEDCAGGDADLGKLVTGVVVACEGYASPIDGCFHASKLLFTPPSCPRADNAGMRLATAAASGSGPAPLLVLASGLDIGGDKCNHLQLQLLIDYLTGNVGSVGDQGRSSQVVRVVLAGGTLSLTDSYRHAIGSSANETKNPNEHDKVTSTNNGASVRCSAPRATLKAKLREVDVALCELASGVPMDVMPGEGEPTNHNVPQQPFHKMLFPGLERYVGGSVRMSTNPHSFTEHGVRFLGTSGQNIQDVYRYSTIESELDILSETLTWGCLAPTAPDTLPCYPVADRDVFAIEEWPDVYFTGMAREFGTRMTSFKHEDGRTSSTRLVSVPDFQSTGTVAVVDLRTMECSAMKFDAVGL